MNFLHMNTMTNQEQKLSSGSRRKIGIQIYNLMFQLSMKHGNFYFSLCLYPIPNNSPKEGKEGWSSRGKRKKKKTKKKQTEKTLLIRKSHTSPNPRWGSDRAACRRSARPP